MTTGSLKLLSLLVVIAAGGGAVWHVQQGILHPQKTLEEATAALEGDETSDASSDPFTDANVDTASLNLDQPSLHREEPAGWDQDEERAPRRSASTPTKFQRAPRNGPSIGSAIPARAAALDQAEVAEQEEPSTDFQAEANPDSSAGELVIDPVASTSVAPKGRRTFAGSRGSSTSSDPFDESPGLVLTSNDDVPAETEADDPFAGAAPPELSTETGDSDPLERSRLRDDEPESGAAMPSTLGDVPEKKSTRIPKRQPTPPDAEPVPARNTSKAFDVEPRLGVPATSVTEDFGGELPTTLNETSSSPSARGSRRAPKSTHGASEDPAPRLLPVPDAPVKKSSPRLPVDLDASDRGLPDLGGFGPTDNAFRDDELHGDGTPDRDAPQGLQQPRLTIEKIAPKQAVVGQPLVYAVVVKNVGSADAHQVTVEDRIPKGTKLEGTSPRAELIDKRLVWKLGTIKPDEQKKISIKLIPQEQGPIGSVAKVNFVAEIAAEIEVTAPQILVSIDAPSQVRLGSKLQIVFKIRNAGRADARNVIVRNLIPEGLRHPAGVDLEYAMGTLPAQESREIKLDLIATKNGKVANKTIITADGGVNVEEDTPVEVIGEQLLLTRTGKNRLFVDKAAVFTSTVANEGTASATKVMVAEVVPAGLEFVSASDNGKYDPVTRAVTWSVGPIGPGEELKLSTKLMPKNLGDYRATVTVTGPAGSVATVDAELKIDGFPAVAVESKSNARLISVGEKATIRIGCKNQGTAAAKNLILSASLPPELKLVDGKGPAAWARQGNVITFEAIPHLDPSETATFDVQVEGVAEGDTRIELQISADHLNRPLHRDETIRVAPEAE